MANSVTPTVSLTVDGDVYTFHTFSVFKNHASSFKLNEEFDEETPDGRTVRSVITLEGDRMLHRQLGDNPTTIDRTFSATEVTVVSSLIVGQLQCDGIVFNYTIYFPQTMTYNGVVCTRKYAAVE